MRSAIERYVIKHLSGSKANQVEEFDFNKNELKLGRAADCQIQFDPEVDVLVSREHGKIVKDGVEPPEFSIIDNNSRNGIFVNRERVKGTAKLHPGDEVQLGNNGPVFVFDIFPRPQDMMMATRVVEIPTSIKPTTISEVQPANVVSSEPVKTGLGKQTVERMLVAERKKSTGKMAVVLGSIVLILGILGYAFRSKLFPKPQVTVLEKKTTTTVTDPKLVNKKSPDQIAKDNDDKVVAIEFTWHLIDRVSNQELWHLYTPIKDQKGNVVGSQPVFVKNQQGGIEPYIDTKEKVNFGVPVAVVGASGSGFVVSADGFILTNRHVAAGWLTRYDAFYGDQGALATLDKNGKMVIIPGAISKSQFPAWVPANATMRGLNSTDATNNVGENTYLRVIFSGTSLRREVKSVQPSENHDVAMIKVDMVESLSAVKLKDNYDSIEPGQSVTVMGYPGVAPVMAVARKSNDPFNPQIQYATVPTPTVTPGSIGRILLGTNDKADRYSGFGNSYQLTINATGAGNSGGPMFDDEGNVIGIFYASMNRDDATRITFAVPIKYGMELMGRVKVLGK